jgi:DNA-binding protein Fis
MNAQDFRSLQEAYMEVVMNEGEQPYPSEKVKKSIKRKFSDVNMQRVYMSDGPRTDDLEQRAIKQDKIHKKMVRKVKKQGNQQEQTDLYDIILSHLLDEGYADTQEQAEAIMVNMSEEWRDSILG